MIDLHKEAQKREGRGRALTGDAQHFSKDCHLIGVCGEAAFALLLGEEYVPAQQPDAGVDFEINSFRIDVKTTQKGMYLLEKKSARQQLRADIYVLARFTHTKPASLWVFGELRQTIQLVVDDKLVFVYFLGWEWGHILKKQPAKSFGHGVVSHYEHVSKLKPMARLLKLLKGE